MDVILIVSFHLWICRRQLMNYHRILASSVDSLTLEYYSSSAFVDNGVRFVAGVNNTGEKELTKGPKIKILVTLAFYAEGYFRLKTNKI
jgi:hypothetical protein